MARLGSGGGTAARIWARLRTGIPSPQSVVRDVASGSVVAVISLTYCISFGALIFSGSLAGGLAVGLNAILLGAGVTGVVIALASSLPRAVGGPDTPAVAVFSALAVSVAAALPAGMPPQETTLFVLAAISFATLITGTLLLALSVLRLGSVVRFVPFSVVAGFLAASGCLLIAGAFRVATERHFSWTALVDVVTQAAPGAPRLAFALVFALAVLVIRLRFRHFFVLPACVLAGIAAAHGLFAAGLIVGDPHQLGWLLDMPTAPALVLPLADGGRLAALLPLLLDGAGEIAAVAVVTAMAVILNTSGLEAVWKANCNLDREFGVAGLANIAAGLAGGIAGNVSLNRSMLNGECGAVGRLSAVVPGVACLALLLVDRALLTAIPTPVLGGLLLFLGLSILANSLGWASPRRDWPELLLVLLITGLILFVGYLEGLVVGLIGACLLFAYTYSRVNIIKHEFTRSDRSSNVERSIEHSRFLTENGELVRVVSLHGYLFFATSSRLVDDLRQRFHDRNGRRIACLVIDFRLVSGLDTSTVLSFVKLRNACEENAIRMAFCGLSPAVAEVLGANRQRLIDGTLVREFASLHDALEWSEEVLLRERGGGLMHDEAFSVWLDRQVGGGMSDRRILAYLERVNFAAGAQVVAQGDPSDSIDLVDSGRVNVVLERTDGPPIRLRSMLGRTVLGEMGFYRDRPRTASVIAEQATVIYRMRRAAFDRMAAQDPDAAAAFHRFIVCVLADRLSFANSEIAVLDL